MSRSQEKGLRGLLHTCPEGRLSPFVTPLAFGSPFVAPISRTSVMAVQLLKLRQDGPRFPLRRREIDKANKPRSAPKLGRKGIRRRERDNGQIGHGGLGRQDNRIPTYWKGLSTKTSRPDRPSQPPVGCGEGKTMIVSRTYKISCLSKAILSAGTRYMGRSIPPWPHGYSPVLVGYGHAPFTLRKAIILWFPRDHPRSAKDSSI